MQHSICYPFDYNNNLNNSNEKIFIVVCQSQNKYIVAGDTPEEVQVPRMHKHRDAIS